MDQKNKGGCIAWDREWGSKERGKKKGEKKKRQKSIHVTHLGIFGAFLRPAGRGQDVRFLRGGMDALVAEVDDALACLV